MNPGTVPTSIWVQNVTTLNRRNGREGILHVFRRLDYYMNTAAMQRIWTPPLCRVELVYIWYTRSRGNRRFYSLILASSLLYISTSPSIRRRVMNVTYSWSLNSEYSSSPTFTGLPPYCRHQGQYFDIAHSLHPVGKNLLVVSKPCLPGPHSELFSGHPCSTLQVQLLAPLLRWAPSRCSRVGRCRPQFSYRPWFFGLEFCRGGAREIW